HRFIVERVRHLDHIDHTTIPVWYPATLEPAAAAHLALPQPERLRRDLEQFVLADPLETLFEVHDPRRRELDALVRRRRAHVGELLFLRDVDVEVVVARVLADDLSLVHLLARADEHHPARLQVVDGVPRRAPRAVRDERAVLAVRDVAL